MLVIKDAPATIRKLEPRKETPDGATEQQPAFRMTVCLDALATQLDELVPVPEGEVGLVDLLWTDEGTPRLHELHPLPIKRLVRNTLVRIYDTPKPKPGQAPVAELRGVDWSKPKATPRLGHRMDLTCRADFCVPDKEAERIGGVLHALLMEDCALTVNELQHELPLAGKLGKQAAASDSSKAKKAPRKKTPAKKKAPTKKKAGKKKTTTKKAPRKKAAAKKAPDNKGNGKGAEKNDEVPAKSAGRTHWKPKTLRTVN